MTTVQTHEQMTDLVDRHFSGTIRPRDERRMREHLPTCAPCREHYQRHLVLGALDPDAIPARIRIGVGLGLAPRSKSWWPWLTGASLAAATALFLVALPRASVPDLGFQARGAKAAPIARLFIYRLKDGSPPVRAQRTIHANDELGFAYQNPAGYERLLVFGVDSNRQVHWYYPAWTAATETPRAVPIARDSEVHELPEAVSHVLPTGPLRVIGVFANKSYNVKEAEEAVGAASSAARLPLAETQQIVEEFEVQP
jgi:hypothetical protein